MTEFVGRRGTFLSPQGESCLQMLFEGLSNSDLHHPGVQGQLFECMLKMQGPPKPERHQVGPEAEPPGQQSRPSLT